MIHTNHSLPRKIYPLKSDGGIVPSILLFLPDSHLIRPLILYFHHPVFYPKPLFCPDQRILHHIFRVVYLAVKINAGRYLIVTLIQDRAILQVFLRDRAVYAIRQALEKNPVLLLPARILPCPELQLFAVILCVYLQKILLDLRKGLEFF